MVSDYKRSGRNTGGLTNTRSKRARIDAITAYTAKVLKDGPGSADVDSLLYDELGLPK